MTKVTIVGCGIIGATIAYELSQIPQLQITVVEAQPETALFPVHKQGALSSTSAALGVLLGVLNRRRRGHRLQMGLTGLAYYDRVIPQLEALTNQQIPYNRQGILRLQPLGTALIEWEQLVQIRQQQGWPLELWDRERLRVEFPGLNFEQVGAGVYSPHDRQVDPIALTQALVKAAQHQGATVHFNTPVTKLTNRSVHTNTEIISTDWIILAAGIASVPLIQPLVDASEPLSESPSELLSLQPVLGQAVQVKVPAASAIGGSENTALPVITGADFHIIPLGNCEYWIGATVEFPPELSDAAPQPQPDRLSDMMHQAIALYPGLAQAEIRHTWQGSRPRPQGRPAPIVEPLPGYPHIWLATGHYRNGVLLAPATAQRISQHLQPT